MSFTLNNPFQYWNNPNNSNPVGLGKLYVGLPDLNPETPANRVTVKAVQQDGTEVTLSQPIQLLAGGVPSFNGSPVQLKIEVETVSVKLNSTAGAQVYYTPRWSVPSKGMVSLIDLADPLTTIIIAGVAAKSLARRYSEFVNVADFGAVGNGVTDDTAAIQAALDASSGKTLYFDKKTYKTTSSLLIKGNLTRLECRGATIDYFGSSFAVGFDLIGGTTYPVECGIRQLNIIVNSGSSSSGLQVRTSYSQYEEVSVAMRAAATDAKGFVIIGDEINGTGAYYNLFLRCSVQSATNGADHIGVLFSTSAPSFRAPNANTWIGGRIGQCLKGFSIKGNGNCFYNPTIENAPLTGTSISFDADTSVNCQGNQVYSAYVENANIAVLFNTNSSSNAVYSPFLTGVNLGIVENGINNFYIDYVKAASLPNGVKFRNLSTDVDVLDYYGEGVWTPTLVGNTTPGSYSLSVSAAKYTRVGNLVTLTAQVEVTVGSAGTGELRFGGMPFPKGDNSVLAGGVYSSNVTLNTDISSLSVAAWSMAVGSTFAVVGSRTGAALRYISCADIITGSRFTFSFSYFTS